MFHLSVAFVLWFLCPQIGPYIAVHPGYKEANLLFYRALLIHIVRRSVNISCCNWYLEVP